MTARLRKRKEEKEALRRKRKQVKDARRIKEGLEDVKKEVSAMPWYMRGTGGA